MKCVIDAKLWQSVVGCLKDIREDIAFKFQPNGLNIRQFDHTHTLVIDLMIPTGCWDEYTPVDFPMVLCVKDMSEYLKRLRAGDKVVLSGDLEKESKILMGIRSHYGFRRFGLTVMEVGEEEKDPPMIKKFMGDVKAKVATKALAEAMADAEGVVATKSRGEVTGHFTIEGRSKPERLIVWSTEEGTLKSSWYEFTQSLGLLEMECSGDKIRGMYGIAQVKAVLLGGALSNIVWLGYADSLPIKFSYQLAFPGHLEYWVAPRVEVR